MRAPAKVNTFLKITGKRGNYHELSSRFVQVDDLYDDVLFEPKERPNAEFELIGDFGCKTEKNTIYKAFVALKNAGFTKEVEAFFQDHRVCVTKNIPEFAGLGGGSSDAATFLLLCNKELGLELSKEALGSIGEQVGADVPFFVYESQSANVTGIGEIVVPFDETVPALEVMTPAVHCSTPEVFRAFREHFWGNIDHALAKEMLTQTSRELLTSYKAVQLNDLFLPAVHCYPALQQYLDEGWMMSGSGSTMFRIKNG